MNIFSSPLVARLNSISVWWHVLGVIVIIAILIIVPDKHASADFVFTERINNSGFADAATSGGMFWFYVLPLGFLLTMYTVTGYDASAHVSEETQNASVSAAKGVWQSVFYSAIIGWFVLLAITFAVGSADVGNEAAGYTPAIFAAVMDSWAAKLVILIALIGQLFCGMSCLTSASRMTFAFSRDGAIPGHKAWTRLNHHRVPYMSVLFIGFWALVITLPALKGNEGGIPFAFFAIVSIAVIGLYIAYVIPVFLRWRQGDAYERGPWNLGEKYKWINPIAIIWVVLCVIIFSLPFVPAAVPGNEDFTLGGVQLRARHRDRGDHLRGHPLGGQRQQDVPLARRGGRGHPGGRDRRAAEVPRGPVGPQDSRDVRPALRRAGRAPEQWHDPRSFATLRRMSETLSVLEPATEGVLQTLPRAGVERDRRGGRPRGRGPARLARARRRGRAPGILRDLTAALEDAHEELALLEARNAGKPIEAARGEIGGAIATFRYFSGSARAAPRRHDSRRRRASR